MSSRVSGWGSSQTTSQSSSRSISSESVWVFRLNLFYGVVSRGAHAGFKKEPRVGEALPRGCGRLQL